MKTAKTDMVGLTLRLPRRLKERLVRRSEERGVTINSIVIQGLWDWLEVDPIVTHALLDWAEKQDDTEGGESDES